MRSIVIVGVGLLLIGCTNVQRVLEGRRVETPEEKAVRMQEAERDLQADIEARKARLLNGYLDRVETVQFTEMPARDITSPIQMSTERPAAWGHAKEIGILRIQGKDIDLMGRVLRIRANQLGADAIANVEVTRVAVRHEAEERAGLRVTVGNPKEEAAPRILTYETVMQGVALRLQ